MRLFARILGLLALAGTIIPPALFMFKLMPLDTVKWIMLAATLAWFITAPVWMRGSD